MHPEEYERKYDKELPKAMDDVTTVGTTPDVAFESSPDVAVDGSIERGDDRADEDENDRGGLLGRLREWLF